MGLQSGLLGLVSLIIIISITFYGINQVRHLQSDYQEKLKDIASQVNASQKYQARMDRKNQNNMENANHLMESIKGGYANKTELSKKIDTQQMQVGNMIKADKHATELNGNMLLTAAASRYTRNDNNNAEISNDLGVNKQLMIMGNSSGGTADRKIGIMNKLDVNGGLEVDLDSTSFEVTGRDLVSVGDSSAWMRKDGYVFGKNMIDSKDVMGETLKAGQTEFAKDGTLKASNNVRAFGQMAGSQITGRKTVSVGNAEMSDLGNVKGRQLCMDGVCLLASDINYMKANSNPKDCLVGEWTDWGGCNKPCGNGMQFRWRNVLRPAEYDGLACPHLSEQKPCNLGTCLTSEPVYPAVDCVLSDWSAWDACSKTCGGGTQKRTKTILQPSENAGIPCPTLAELKQERPCNPDACPPPPVPRDCVLSDWSEYSACSAPCGGGKKTKTRTILQIAANGGLACPPESDLRFDADCNTDACVMSKLAVAVNTEWSVIQFKNLPSITTSGEWFVVFTTVNNAGNLVKVGMTTILKRVGSSTLSAGMGYTNLNQWNNQRAVFDASYVFKSVEFWSVNPATGALVDVPFNSFVLSVDNFDTGIDCMLNWSAWGSCSVTCGGGTRTRTATVIKNGSGIGSVCPTSLTQSDPCNTQPCNTTSFTYTINTEFSVIRFANLPSITTTAEWYIAFSNINGGTLTRVGTTTVTKRLNGSYALSAGMGFTNLNQWNNQTVYFDASYVFNTVEFWSYSATSGVVSIPLNSFQLSSTNFTTGIDCVLQWPDWSACSVSCGGGTQTRTATVIKNGSGIGTTCPAITQTQPCNKTACPIYFIKGNFSAYQNLLYYKFANPISPSTITIGGFPHWFINHYTRNGANTVTVTPDWTPTLRSVFWYRGRIMLFSNNNILAEIQMPIPLDSSATFASYQYVFNNSINISYYTSVLGYQITHIGILLEVQDNGVNTVIYNLDYAGNFAFDLTTLTVTTA